MKNYLFSGVKSQHDQDTEASPENEERPKIKEEQLDLFSY
jgi:hypothetical protein